MATLAEALQQEADALRRRFEFQTRSRRLLTLNEAVALCCKVSLQESEPRAGALPVRQPTEID